MPSRSIVLLALLAVAGTTVTAQDAAARSAAAQMDQKVQAILARGMNPARSSAPVKTAFTDAEVNAYLRIYTDPASGIRQPTIAILDNGKIDSRALVDLDAVRTSEKRGWLDPLAYVTGIVEVRTIGTLRAVNGKGVYMYESATVGGAPVPRAVFQELLAFYTKSPDMPKGVVLDAPFDLPARIREVEIRRGMATVIQ